MIWRMKTQNLLRCLNVVIVFFAVLLPSFSPAYASKTRRPKKPALVKHLGDSQLGPYVALSKGNRHGYVIGLDMCLYNDEGQKTGCGIVEESNQYSSGIRLPKDTQTSVTEGNRAWRDAWGPLPLPEGYAELDDLETVEEQEEPALPPVPPELARLASFNLASYLSLPVVVNNLKFDASARAANAGTVWTSGDEIKRSLIGFNLDIRIPRPGPWDLGLLLGYSFLPQAPIKSDFDVTDSSQTVLSYVSGHFYRIGANTGYALVQGDSHEWMVSSGLEIWLIQHRFGAAHSDGTTLAQGQIVNALIGLPVSTWWQIYGEKWSFNTGLDVILPLYMGPNRASGVIGYAEATQAAKDISDVQAAINPKKAVGYSIRLGIGRNLP
jgi:hypothetical protein